MEDLGPIGLFLERDHKEIDDLFKTYQDAKRGGGAALKEVFCEFDDRLRRHIDWEEEFLFPIFERRTEGQMGGRPTVIMRHEHEQIKMYLGLIADALESNETHQVYEEALLTTLQEHNRKEENILYPWFDRELTEEETDAIVQKIRGSAGRSRSRHL